MATFNLELRVQTAGAVIAWEVFLENTSAGSRVGNWIHDSEKKSFIKELPDYKVTDGKLDVFVGSEGKIGGRTICTVFIDGKEKSPKVTSNNTDLNYAHGTYDI